MSSKPELPAQTSPIILMKVGLFPSGETLGVITQKKDLVEIVLGKDGVIDFMQLFSPENKGDDIVSCLKELKKKNDRVLFDCFDFLNREFFQKIPAIMPGDSLKIIRNDIFIKDQIIVYIKERNKGILSMQVTEKNMNSSIIQNMEQHDIISFHLFLLGMDLDFDLIEDVSDKLSGVEELFGRYICTISEKIGQIRMGAWNAKEIFDQKLSLYIELCETINQLARLYSANFEERGVSPRIGKIMEKEIQRVITELETSPCGQEKIPQLRDILGKPDLNFSTGIPITGSKRGEILESVEDLIRKTLMGFETRKKAGVSPLKRLNLVCTGNETIIKLRGLEKIEKFDGPLTPEENQEKRELLSALFRIYNEQSDVPLSDFSSDGVIQNFIEGGVIKNEDQIETIYHIVHFDRQIKSTVLQELLGFLFNILLGSDKEKDKDKKFINSFYEASVIKIIEQIIRIFSDRGEDIIGVDRLEDYLMTKNISNSILNHSLVYLALALYYLDRDIGKAQEFLFHYKNLKPKIISQEIEEMENRFHATFWKKTNASSFSLGDDISYKSMVSMGRVLFEYFSETHRITNVLDVENEVNRLNSSMNIEKTICPLERINMLGGAIAKQIFYNLCTITVIGDCLNCRESREHNGGCDTSEQPSGERIKNCPLIRTQRGFQREQINLTDEASVMFIYPSFFKGVFEKIFSKQKDFLEERFSALMASNANIQTIIYGASHDKETGLRNKNKLQEDLLGKKRTVVAFEITDYDRLIRGGVENWTILLRQMGKYFKTKEGVELYHFDGKIFHIVLSQDKIEDLWFMSGSNMTHFHKSIIATADSIIGNFQIEYAGHFEYIFGIAVGKNEGHIKGANIALEKAKKQGIPHILREIDEEEERNKNIYEEILKDALSDENEQYTLYPGCQRIYYPKDPDRMKIEVLARIKNNKPGITGKDGKYKPGEEPVIFPGSFIDIARSSVKYGLPKITQKMLDIVRKYLEKHPILEAGINFDEQDWRHNGVMSKLREIRDDGVNTSRIMVEIVENVSLDRWEKKNEHGRVIDGEDGDDKKQIQELRDMGYKIALDDCGTCGGSNGKIIQVGPDAIKIDGKAVIQKLNDIKQRPDAISTIKYYIDIAHSSGKEVIAEYVETKEIFEMLLELGVDGFQGHYFAKAVPFDELEWGELKTA